MNKATLIMKWKMMRLGIKNFLSVKHNNRLTTSFGNFIYKISYGKIAKYISGLILFSAIYFWALNPFNHGTDQADLTILTSLYFSIITFTSLGYGDISPIGLGKFIASIEVLFGLVLTAIFIGKVASEKQFAMLRLVYTSEHQKRIAKFENQTNKIIKLIDKALEEHDHEKLYSLSRTNYRFIASLYNYLKFQANQGDLATYGNDTSLKRLYNGLLNLQLAMSEAIKTFGTQPRTQRKFQQIMARVEILSKMMLPFHRNNKKIIVILNHIETITKDSNKWISDISTNKSQYKYRSGITEKLLTKVKEKMPVRPWPRHVHKIIAKELGIQNQLAQKCINILIKREM